MCTDTTNILTIGDNMENKSKILYLYKLLYEKTDEQNPLSTNEIITQLAKIGISLNRKTVASDIALLMEFGVDVITIRSSQNMYYIGNREFELPEIKLLIDAVESSKLITVKKSKKLVDKLAKFASKEQSKELNRNIYIDNRIKPTNEKIYYNIDLIQTAITQTQRIEFKYFDYNGDKEIVYKHNGALYTLSPYAMAWDNDHYYAIGYNDKHGGISRFRIDRMAKVKISDKPYVHAPDNFVVAEYVKSIFNMYGGEKSIVEIKCTNDAMKFIVDKFGENVKTQTLGSNCFKAIVEVSVSPTFYSWVFQFCDKMQILAPESVKNGYAEMLRAALKNMI